MSLLKIRRYDYSSLFDDRDIESMKSDIQSLVDQGKYVTGIPLYQSRSDFLDTMSGDHWVKLKASLLSSAMCYVGGEVYLKNLKCWSLSNKVLTEEDHVWHTHDSGGEGLVGVFYLQNGTGTDLFLDERFDSNVPVTFHGKKANWLLYPKNLYHRPSPHNGEMRYVIAMDFEL